MAESITIETDLFEHRNVGPEFINRCCFGEDFAAWLRQQLLDRTELEFAFSESIQDDYGWGFWGSRGGDRFWIALSYVGDGPQEAPAQWIVSVSHDSPFRLIKRLFRQPDIQSLGLLRTCVEQILSSNPAIAVIKT